MILTFNSLATLPRCIGTLLPTLGEADEVLFVDNASTDGTVEHLPALEGVDPRFRMFYKARNLGFAAGSNVGLRAATNEFVVLLNPDTGLRAGWLDAMQAHFNEAATGAVGPTSNYVAGLQQVGLHLSESLAQPRTFGEIATFVKSEYAGQAVETKLLIGFCVMLRKSVLDNIGYLDEDLVQGSEDLELSWRLRLKGFRLRVARDVCVEHTGGASFRTLPTGDKGRLFGESTQNLLRKLEQHYGTGSVPSSVELFGIPILETPKSDSEDGSRS